MMITQIPDASAINYVTTKSRNTTWSRADDTWEGPGKVATHTYIDNLYFGIIITAFVGVFSPRNMERYAKSPISIASVASEKKDEGTPGHIAFEIPFLSDLGFPQPMGKPS